MSHVTRIFTSWKAILALVFYIKQDFKNTGKYLCESDVFSEEFILLTFLRADILEDLQYGLFTYYVCS